MKCSNFKLSDALLTVHFTSFFFIHAVNCKNIWGIREEKESRKWDGLTCHWLGGERDDELSLHPVLALEQSSPRLFDFKVLAASQSAAAGSCRRWWEASASIHTVNRSGEWSTWRLLRHCSRHVLDSPRGWGCSGGAEGFWWGLWLSEAALREERWSKVWTEMIILDRKHLVNEMWHLIPSLVWRTTWPLLVCQHIFFNFFYFFFSCFFHRSLIKWQMDCTYIAPY